MRTLSESIIGRKGSYKSSSKIPGRFYLARDLEYGDIVKAAFEYYIYLPVAQHLHWWMGATATQRIISSQSGIPVRYNSTTSRGASLLSVDPSIFKYEFVGYAEEYKDIKTPEDLKAVFDKYNIPYE